MTKRGPRIKKWEGTVPSTCQLCGAELKQHFIDGATKLGPWAMMCTACHKNAGDGLGVGKGQKYEKRGQLWIKIGG